jgi:hypothetical protein
MKNNNSIVINDNTKNGETNITLIIVFTSVMFVLGLIASHI